MLGKIVLIHRQDKIYPALVIKVHPNSVLSVAAFIDDSDAVYKKQGLAWFSYIPHKSDWSGEGAYWELPDDSTG